MDFSTAHLSVLTGPNSRLKGQEVHEVLRKIVENNSVVDETALIFEENGQVKNVTYRELHRLSDRLADRIRKLVGEKGLASNNDKFIVAVNMHPSEFLIVTLLAVWKAGAAYLPLDPNFPAERIDYILSDSKPAMVIHDKEGGNYPNTFKLCVKDCMTLNEVTTNGIHSETQQHKIPVNDDLAIVMYTSGSTGVPKGVCISHTMILNRLEWQFKAFPFSSTEKVCVFKTVITFVDCIFEIWGPLMKGRSLLILPKTTTQNPEKLVNVMDKYGVERIVLVPTLLRMILAYKTISNNMALLSRLNLWICSGEVLSPSLVDEFYSKFDKGTNKLCNFYGSTEFVDVTYHVLTSPEDLKNHESVPLGIPGDNSIIYLLDENLNIVKQGERGEIYVAGLSVLKTYMNPVNQDRLIKNPHNNVPEFSMISKSGDVGYVKNGVLYYVHRTDTIVKIRGKKIDMLEIDKTLYQIDGVKRTVVLCYHAGEPDQNILAFAQTESTLTAKQIESALALKLPDYMVPTVVLIEEFPLLINGKVDRQTLLKNHEENLKNRHVEFDYEGVPQRRKEDAKLLFETISSLSDGLFDDLISLKANFFHVGGNSLNAIFTISKLREHGLHISIHDFVNAANFGEILNKLTGESVSFEASSKYSRRFITNDDKNTTFNIFKNGYFKKSHIDFYIIKHVSEADIDTFLETIWPSLLEQAVSFLIFDKSTNQVVGMSLNLDCDMKFNCKVDNKIQILNELYEDVEVATMDLLKKKYGRLIYGNWAATVEWLSPQENVAVMHYIEYEILKIAKDRGFNVIASTNLSPITKQLAEEVLGYTRIVEYKLNEFVFRGSSKPFTEAPDSEIIYVHYKVV